MKSNRAVRVALGLIVLILFGAYTYLHASNTPHSKDLDAQAASTPDISLVESAEPTEAVPTATPEPTLDPDSPAGRAAALGLPEPPDVDVTSWELMLVNPTHLLDANYAPPEIVNVGSSACPQDSRIADALSSFAQGCSDAGLSVYLSSGYRSYSDQQYLYNRKISQGYSAEEAAKIVAIPGTSEHQSGLCCDITDYYRELKDSSLEDTDTFKWLNEHCAEYGFILRFPSDKQDITCIMYEPWHFRYVGVEAATYIKANNLCLEEFLALYGVV